MVPRASSRFRAAGRLFAIVGLVTFSASACDNMPLTAPSGTSITLLAATSNLPIDGSAEITAVLIEGGTGTTGNQQTVLPGVGTPVHNGTVVSFRTTLGRIEPSESETKDGRATARLIADGRSGTATITAFSGPASKTLEVTIGAAPASPLSISSNAPRLAAGTSLAANPTVSITEPLSAVSVGVAAPFTVTPGANVVVKNLSVDMGDGSINNLGSQAGATTFSHFFGSSGIVTVTARLTDAGNKIATFSIPVAVAPLTVTLAISGGASPKVDTPLTFLATPATGAAIDHYEWTFGDGSDTLTTAGPQAVHGYTNLGPILVTVKVVPVRGPAATTSLGVVIVN